ncbi:MAG TPA: ATP-binding protein, partial [Negativicutes bacterium]|nr:ATP-binding protein [Negativicutes bacterium]
HETMTGFSAEELAGMKLHDWFKGDENALLELEEIKRKLLRGEVANSVMPLLTKTGERIPMKFSTVRIIVEGKPYLAGIGLDISELKKAQKELEAANKSLEGKVLERTRELMDANRELLESYEKVRSMQGHLVQSEKMAALGGLVAGVTHEINTPIGVGVTAASHLMDITQEFLGILRSDSINREELASYAEDIEQSAGIIFKNLNRASKLVKSFKQVSADQASEPRRSFQVREYLEEILTSLSPKLKKTRIKVKVDCDSAISIDGYPGAFAQIISNLVINSLVHAFGPDDEGNIYIRVSQKKGMIELVYSDDGRGISNAGISKIFDPFYTTNRSNGGTGLGLSVVYNIVTQQYGGTIQCESQPGKGTTFVMLLKQGGI